MRVTQQEERQQNEMLRRAAQRSIANTGRVASEREIKSWMKDNKDEYLRKAQQGTPVPVSSHTEENQ